MKWASVKRGLLPNWWLHSLILIAFMLAIVVYVGKEKYTGYETSTGRPATISVRPAIEDWNRAIRIYKDATGKNLTSSAVADQLSDQDIVDVTNKLTLDQISGNADRARGLKYTIRGQVVDRVRTSKNQPNYLNIKVGDHTIRVYYYDLPYQVAGDKVTVKGVIIGRSATGRLLMVSSTKNTLSGVDKH